MCSILEELRALKKEVKPEINSKIPVTGCEKDTVDDNNSTDNDYLDSNQASEMFNIKISTLHRRCREERIPHYRFPAQRIRFDEGELTEWLKQKKPG